MGIRNRIVLVACLVAGHPAAQTIEDCNRIADANRRVACYRAAPQSDAAAGARRNAAPTAASWPAALAVPKGDPVAGLFILTLGGLIYFAPALLALARGAAHVGGVFVVNLFLGWTLVGWVAALAWAVSSARATNGSAGDELRALAAGLAETAERARANARPTRASAEAETNRLRERLEDAPLTSRELTDEQEELVRSRARRAYPCAIAGILRGDEGIARAKALAALRPGAVLRLIPEPDNPVDPLAVAVMKDGARLGYVPRSKRWIADALAEGDQLAAVLSRIEEAEGHAVAAAMLVLVLEDG